MIGGCSMKKRSASVLLCFFLCVTLFPVSAQAVVNTAAGVPEIPIEGDVWDGTTTVPTILVQKDGVYYYEITKCSELAYIAETKGDWLSRNYFLSNNLILNRCGATTVTKKSWNSIDGFTGIFDGNNYVISGLSSYGDNAGLFGSTNGAEIKNIIVLDAYVSGTWSAGGIVADATQTTIQNCCFNGSVSTSNGNTTSEHGCGGICGYIKYGSIANCKNYGTVNADYHIGGICGRASAEIRNCINYGTISCFDNTKSEYLGGIVGRCSNVYTCTNYGDITGGTSVGGIAGFINYYLSDCQNSGNISGVKCVGGIAGTKAYDYTLSKSLNTGTIAGETSIGGIAGEMTGRGSAITSCNIGKVCGTAYIGGIAGSCSSAIKNSFNTGSVDGSRYVGGLSGYTSSCTISTSYNAGRISGEENVGAVVGTDNIIWGRDTIENVYYLKTGTINADIYGSSFSSETDAIIPLSLDDAKTKEPYSGFSFTDIWGIDPTVNGGYPYLQWQESMLSDIPVNSVQLNETALSLGEGDCAYLTATVSPVNASDQFVTWSSSNSDVAMISTAGKVTAVSPGIAIVTVTTEDGGYTATCAVTVTERTSEEYKINSITVRNDDGAVLSAIPNGNCFATVSITNLASEGNTLILLAAYTSTGQYQGMMWVSAEDLPIDATIEITLPVDNSDGKIADLKAFTVASFLNLTPLGDAVSFLP